MKPLLKACCSTLDQVQFILKNIEHNADANLYQSSGISRHIRHILDHFLALQNGLEKSYIDYNQRNRNGKVEQDLQYAQKLLESINTWLATLNSNKKLTIESEIDCAAQVSETFESNFDRELLYLINHTLHHTAYIKLVAANNDIDFPDEIGLAPCTATFIRQSAVA